MGAPAYKHVSQKRFFPILDLNLNFTPFFFLIFDREPYEALLAV